MILRLTNLRLTFESSTIKIHGDLIERGFHIFDSIGFAIKDPGIGRQNWNVVEHNLPCDKDTRVALRLSRILSTKV